MSISCRVNYTWHFHSTLAFSPRSRQTHRSLCWNTSPDAFIEADKQEIVDVIKPTARFGLTYANNKYHAIIQAAHEAQAFGYIIDSNIRRIRLYISFIRKYDVKVQSKLTLLSHRK